MCRSRIRDEDSLGGRLRVQGFWLQPWVETELGAQPSLLAASVTMATSHKSASVLPCQMGKIVLTMRIRWGGICRLTQCLAEQICPPLRSHSPKLFLFANSHYFFFLPCSLFHIQCQLLKDKGCVRCIFMLSTFPSRENVPWLFVEWLYEWMITCKCCLNILTVHGRNFKVWSLILANSDIWSEQRSILYHRSALHDLAWNNLGKLQI